MAKFKAMDFRAKPTAEQKEIILKTFGCVRFAHNALLEEKIKHFEKTGKTLFNTPAHLKETHGFLSECDSMALCNVQQDLEKSWSVCRLENNLPKFWVKGRGHRTYRTDVIRRHTKGGEEKANIWFNFIRPEENYIHLPKLGDLRFIMHRPIPEDFKLKHLYISQLPSGEFKVSFVFKVSESVKDEPGSAIIDKSNDELCFEALDYSMSQLFVSYTGEFDPKRDQLQWFRKMEKKISDEERALSNLELHSNNWWKQRMRCNRLHRKVVNRRRDFLFKLAKRMAEKFDVVIVEGANLEDIARKHSFESVLYSGQVFVQKFGKAVHDNGFGMFRVMLAHMLADRGKLLIKVGRYYPSSQLCHNCHHKNRDAKDVEIRGIVCENCGTSYNRDHNACLNLMDEGKRLLDLYRKQSKEVEIDTLNLLTPVKGDNWA